MSTENNPSATKFISRYVALVQDDLLGNTDAGNPQPALLSAAMAYDNPKAPGFVIPPPRGFYREVNVALNSAGKSLVVFPTKMFDAVDVCVMQKELFVGLLEGKVVDDEAKIVIDHAPSNTLAFVKRLVTGRPTNVETTIE